MSGGHCWGSRSFLAGSLSDENDLENLAGFPSSDANSEGVLLKHLGQKNPGVINVISVTQSK